MTIESITLKTNNAQEATVPKVTGWNIIQEVAKASFRELAISLTFAAVTCSFVATPAGASFLLITALVVVAVNTVFRSLGGYFAYQLQNEESSDSQFYRNGLTFCNYIAPLSFTILDSTTRDVLIHEGGHALAASLLFENSNPKVQINPLQGGVTRFSLGALTRLGQFFGAQRSRLIVAGAGAGAAVLADTVHLAIAHKIRKMHPTLSRYLKVTAIVSLAGHILYALSAFSAESKLMPGHDFVQLWKGGIHPIVSVIGIVALPIIVKAGLFAYDKLRT